MLNRICMSKTDGERKLLKLKALRIFCVVESLRKRLIKYLGMCPVSMSSWKGNESFAGSKSGDQIKPHYRIKWHPTHMYKHKYTHCTAHTWVMSINSILSKRTSSFLVTISLGSSN